MRTQARQLQHVPQGVLTPAPAGLGRGPQRLHELRSLRAHRMLGFGDRLELPGECSVGLRAIALELLDLLPIALEHILEWGDEFSDRRLTGRELGVGANLVLLEDLVGKLEERTLVGTQRFGRHALQALIDAAPYIGERRDLLIMRARLLLQSCLDFDDHGPGLCQFGQQGLATSFEGWDPLRLGLELGPFELLGLVLRAPAFGLEAQARQCKAGVQPTDRGPEDQTEKAAQPSHAKPSYGTTKAARCTSRPAARRAPPANPAPASRMSSPSPSAGKRWACVAQIRSRKAWASVSEGTRGSRRRPPLAASAEARTHFSR